MNKRERSDSKQNKVKVMKAALKNPLGSQRDIAKDAWVSLGNVNSNLNRLEQIAEKSSIIDKICEQDKEIMDLVNDISVIKIRGIKNRIEADEEKISTNEVKTLSEIAEKSTRRYTLFKWDVTNEDGWLKSSKELENSTLEELKNLINNLTN